MVGFCRKVGSNSTELEKVKSLGVRDAPKDNWTPGVEPGGQFVSSLLYDLVQSEGLVKHEVIMGEGFVATVVQGIKDSRKQ